MKGKDYRQTDLATSTPSKFIALLNNIFPYGDSALSKGGHCYDFIKFIIERARADDPDLVIPANTNLDGLGGIDYALKGSEADNNCVEYFLEFLTNQPLDHSARTI